MVLSTCAQELKFVIMARVQIPEVVYEDSQGDILLAKNRQVGMRTKYIDICHHFLRDMLEDNEMNIYIY